MGDAGATKRRPCGRVCFSLSGPFITDLYRDFWKEGRYGYAVKSARVSFREMTFEQALGLVTGKYMLTGDTREGDGTLTLEDDPRYTEFINSKEYVSVEEASGISLNTLVHASSTLATLGRVRRMVEAKMTSLGMPVSPYLSSVTVGIPEIEKLRILDDMVYDALCEELGFDFNRMLDKCKRDIGEALQSLIYLAPVTGLDMDAIDVSKLPMDRLEQYYFDNRIASLAYSLVDGYKAWLENVPHESGAEITIVMTPLIANKTDSCWIHPDGTAAECAYSSHSRMAKPLVAKFYPNASADLVNYENFLENKRWIKMSDRQFYFQDPDGLGPSAPQVDAILDWAERRESRTITWNGVPVTIKDFFSIIAVNNY